ncbi:extracellular solute-binding protein [Paenibacillus sacheonensis]|uniref:Extracellular solute-binding protein n=1 Tax=Paenibacillus sacheonensis TaxID=742054 RepID=A0A7X4YR34_9BACL|nr:extracellular solute-binding protein [Paenibacillus sacheonensis]MBM7567052.1 putative aldouronate transport system substrate-binding protein [Paenibacillus sacheonensis]NBC71017.1 extracellular solute-binding protein [Paenibacillus sacheonensis]
MKLRVLLAVLLIGTLLSACASSPPEEPPEQSQPVAGAIPITVFAQQDVGQNLPTNAFSKYLEQTYGVDFRWQTIPYDGAREKRQISLASGSYADTYILTAYIDQFSKAEVLRYGKQGIFLPLNELIDRYAPHIKAAFAENAALRELNTAPDGNIYGLVSYADCFHCSYPNKMWLNAKWLDKLGLAMPKTTAEFKRVLEAFKTRDPNGNGEADEIPLSGSTEEFGVHIVPFLMNGFIYDDDRDYLTLQGGRVDSAANKPAWKEGLAYIKSLFDEGLIDPGAFTQNAEAYKKLGDNAGEEILGAGAAMHPDIFVAGAATGSRSRDYAPVPPLAGPHASYATHDEGGIAPGAKFVITNKATPEAQIALIKMIDYIYTPDGQMHADSGEEGVGWRRPEPGEQALGKGVLPKYAGVDAKPGQQPNNSGWIGTGHFYMPKSYRDSWVQGTDMYAADGYERRLQAATQLYAGKEPKELFPAWDVWVSDADAQQASVLETNLKNYIDQSTLQFITGAKSLLVDWDSYVQGLDEMGLQAYLSIMQQGYDVYVQQHDR